VKDERIEAAPASAPAAAPGEVLGLLVDGGRRGVPGVLATITGIVGTGARAIGTQMAVLQSGESAGSFSSGCVESAIVAEALEVLARGEARTVRFGQGSPYLDIQLPCGGGMDVLFLPSPDLDVLTTVAGARGERRMAALDLSEAQGAALAELGLPPAPDAFRVTYRPALRLILFGHGAEMLTTLDLAQGLKLPVELLSPDEQIVAAGLRQGAKSVLLTSAAAPPRLIGDRWTAFLLLFHDHDWEPPLLEHALATEALWIGAMGSRRTQAARQAALKARGVGDDAIARVRGPVGLIPNARDPATLALSAVAEIVGAYAGVGG